MKNHLIYRFILVNVAFIAIAVALTVEGYVGWLFANDASGISYAIALLFLVGWGWTAKEIAVASSDLNWSAANGPRHAALAEADKDIGKIAWLSDISETLRQLGYLGTLIGLVVALSGINRETMGTADGAQEAGFLLIYGLFTAIGTTIIGSVLALWHDTNMRLLQTALSTYWNNRLLAPDDDRGMD